MAEQASLPRAIPFITIDVDSDEQDRLAINPEALVALQEIGEAVAVVAIAGRQRTGKSFLLNRIVGRQEASLSALRSMRARKGFGCGASLSREQP